MAKRPTPPSIEHIEDPSSDLVALPPLVAAMREKILEAVTAHDIDLLRPAIERNETPPIFARGPRPTGFAQTIEFLKGRSFDGKGQEILDLLKACFAQPYVKITRGPAETFVWPAFAIRQDPNLSSEQRLAMYTCVRFVNLALTNESGLPLIARIGIGSDGTWHFFWTG